MIADFLPAAYVRGYAARTGAPTLPDGLGEKPLSGLTAGERAALAAIGREAGLKMHRFKDHGTLPRVRKALGFLRGVCPDSLLDVGSGRGVFLLPFLSEFPGVPVTALDLLDHRVEFLGDLQRGGVAALTARKLDICESLLPEKSFDVVTLLEVLEHIPRVERAVCSATRLARRYVVVTVPSKPDDNPEHIHLLGKARLTELFRSAGWEKLQFDAVPGHLFLVASAG